MGRSKSSQRWLQEYRSDPFVQQAQKDGYRSRAVYKLAWLQQRDQFLRPGMCVVELGAAPGGWTQYLSQHIGDHGRIIASDVLSMDTFAGVEFIQGDFTEISVYDAIVASMQNQQADLVLSDMAPNMSGIEAVDQPKSIYLVELAAELAAKLLRPGGSFVSKVFQGSGFDALIRSLRNEYRSVKVRKPDASRSRSKEVYVVALGHNTQH